MSVVTATILSEGRLMDPAYELLALDILKEVNCIPSAQLILLDGDAAEQTFAISDSDFFEPGKVIEIKLRYEAETGSEATVFKGVVVGQGVEVNEQGSVLMVELKDAAIKLTLARKSMVYRKQTDDKIIGQIIEAAGLTKGALAATQPEHAELVQYYCTDWDFILSRAESQGLLVSVDDGVISLATMALAGSPKHSFAYGLSEIFNFEIEADAGQQYPAVQSVAWDVKNQKLTSVAKAKDFSLSQSNLNGAKIAQTLGGGTYTLTSPVALDAKELQAWSDGALARSRLSLLKGRIAVPGCGDIKPLDVMEVSGVGKRFNGQTLVTGVRQRVDQDGWQTDVQFGLAAERFAERQDIVDVPAAGLLPAINGLHVGIVAPFEADPAKEFRVKVILPGIDEKQGAVWARLAAPYAGANRGYFFRPEEGDEVVVGFFNDDPRQAVILGAMHSSKNSPPQNQLPPAKENPQKAIVGKNGAVIGFVDEAKSLIFIQTPGPNTIVLADDDEMILIADQHDNTITLDKAGITIKSAKDVKIEAKGNIEIKGQKVDIK